MGFIIIIFLVIAIVNIVASSKNKKKKRRDTINRRLDELYIKRQNELNKANRAKNINKNVKVEKIGNLEKHYDEAIRSDYKEKVDDYFSEKRKQLDEYLSRDINDRLSDYKESKAKKLLEDKHIRAAIEKSIIEDADLSDDKIEFTHKKLINSIIVKEILDKPLALRRIND